MKIEKYPSFREAIESLTKKDKKYVFLRHSLDAGEDIKLHCHPKANEFLVVDNGVFVIGLIRDQKTLRADGQVIVIRFPKGQNHALFTLAPTSYFVFRDREDETIYLGGKK